MGDCHGIELLNNCNGVMTRLSIMLSMGGGEALPTPPPYQAVQYLGLTAALRFAADPP